MPDIKVLGTLCKNNETGEHFLVPAKESVTVRQPGKIVKQPTPEDVEISKEMKKDYTLRGVLKKHEVSKEELQKQ